MRAIGLFIFYLFWMSIVDFALPFLLLLPIVVVVVAVIGSERKRKCL